MRTPQPLGANARRFGHDATAWMDTLWDPEQRLLRAGRSQAGHTHMIRETCWYAVGLLARGAGGDLERAASAIHGVLDHQFDAPGTVFHGTWRRWPDEPDPAAGAIEWRDYDPNWREFVGTAALLILHEYEAALPGALVRRIGRALRRAVDGSLARGLTADYTNIAIMAAYPST